MIAEYLHLKVEDLQWKGEPLPELRTCLGREPLVDKLRAKFAFTTSKGKRPAPTLPNVPLAGIGGMGKSTVALKLLHDEQVERLFRHHRYFVPLETATSLAGLVEAVCRAVGLNTGTRNDEQHLLDHLRAGRPRLMVLDNAETPLAGERIAVTGFLDRLGAIPHLGLIATLRPDIHLGREWEEVDELPPLLPDAAKEVFVLHGGEQFADEEGLPTFLGELEAWSLLLMLAGVASTEFSRFADFVKVWRQDRQKYLDNGEQSKDANFRVCIDLSLNRVTQEGKRLLSLLALLPDGIAENDLDGVLPEVGAKAARDVRRVGGLTYRKAERLRMPMPLREHLTDRLPPNNEDRRRAVEFYCRLAAEGGDIGTENWKEDTLHADVANCRSAIELSVRLGLDRECGAAVNGFGEYGRFTGRARHVAAAREAWKGLPVPHLTFPVLFRGIDPEQEFAATGQ